MRPIIVSGCALAVVLATASLFSNAADARPQHRVRYHRLFVEEPRPLTQAETTAYDVGQLSGYLVQGIGGATSALPASSYPRSYGYTPPDARPARDAFYGD